jgi:hypothetical protein
MVHLSSSRSEEGDDPAPNCSFTSPRTAQSLLTGVRVARLAGDSIRHVSTAVNHLAGINRIIGRH